MVLHFLVVSKCRHSILSASSDTFTGRRGGYEEPNIHFEKIKILGKILDLLKLCIVNTHVYMEPCEMNFAWLSDSCHALLTLALV